jgi:hypothetical protein
MPDRNMPELPTWDISCGYAAEMIAVFAIALAAAILFASSARQRKRAGPTAAASLMVGSLKLPCHTRAVKYLTNEAAGANPSASAAVVTV